MISYGSLFTLHIQYVEEGRICKYKRIVLISSFTTMHDDVLRCLQVKNTRKPLSGYWLLYFRSECYRPHAHNPCFMSVRRFSSVYVLALIRKTNLIISGRKKGKTYNGYLFRSYSTTMLNVSPFLTWIGPS